jgi:protein subunit release factor A
VGNIKTIGDGSKVFFHEHQFSLAFGEKKSILRNKKRAFELLVSRLGETNNSVEEKNARESLLLLTKSSIFDK